MKAAWNEHADVVKYLIIHGADAEARDGEGESAADSSSLPMETIYLHARIEQADARLVELRGDKFALHEAKKSRAVSIHRGGDEGGLMDAAGLKEATKKLAADQLELNQLRRENAAMGMEYERTLAAEEIEGALEVESRFLLEQESNFEKELTALFNTKNRLEFEKSESRAEESELTGELLRRLQSSAGVGVAVGAPYRDSLFSCGGLELVSDIPLWGAMSVPEALAQCHRAVTQLRQHYTELAEEIECGCYDELPLPWEFEEAVALQLEEERATAENIALLQENERAETEAKQARITKKAHDANVKAKFDAKQAADHASGTRLDAHRLLLDVRAKERVEGARRKARELAVRPTKAASHVTISSTLSLDFDYNQYQSDPEARLAIEKDLAARFGKKIRITGTRKGSTIIDFEIVLSSEDDDYASGTPGGPDYAFLAGIVAGEVSALKLEADSGRLCIGGARANSLTAPELTGPELQTVSLGGEEGSTVEEDEGVISGGWADDGDGGGVAFCWDVWCWRWSLTEALTRLHRHSKSRSQDTMAAKFVYNLWTQGLIQQAFEAWHAAWEAFQASKTGREEAALHWSAARPRRAVREWLREARLLSQSQAMVKWSRTKLYRSLVFDTVGFWRSRTALGSEVDAFMWRGRRRVKGVHLKEWQRVAQSGARIDRGAERGASVLSTKMLLRAMNLWRTMTKHCKSARRNMETCVEWRAEAIQYHALRTWRSSIHVDTAAFWNTAAEHEQERRRKEVEVATADFTAVSSRALDGFLA